MYCCEYHVNHEGHVNHVGHEGRVNREGRVNHGDLLHVNREDLLCANHVGQKMCHVGLK